jgi:hypothetical protein
VFRFTALVPEEEVRRRQLACLELPELLLADCTASRSRRFGITGEIHSTTDYTSTQYWAAAFAAAGFDGVRYLLRHDPGQLLAGVALFGPAGSPEWEASFSEPISSGLLLDVERRFGIRVLPTP